MPYSTLPELTKYLRLQKPDSLPCRRASSSPRSFRRSPAGTGSRGRGLALGRVSKHHRRSACFQSSQQPASGAGFVEFLSKGARSRSRASFERPGCGKRRMAATSSKLFSLTRCHAPPAFSRLPAPGPSPVPVVLDETRAHGATGDRSYPRNPAGVTPAPHLPEWRLWPPVPTSKLLRRSMREVGGVGISWRGGKAKKSDKVLILVRYKDL